MKLSNNSLGCSNRREKSHKKSSYFLLNKIIYFKKDILKGQPPIEIDKIVCKNGCRLGSD